LSLPRRASDAVVEAGAEGAQCFAGADFDHGYDLIAPLFCATADAGKLDAGND
jgi:hypothetical protein